MKLKQEHADLSTDFSNGSECKLHKLKLANNTAAHCMGLLYMMHACMSQYTLYMLYICHVTEIVCHWYRKSVSALCKWICSKRTGGGHDYLHRLHGIVNSHIHTHARGNCHEVSYPSP